ncbi:MAG: hypothetical protein DRN60_04570 [Thaumarchaeota archaeon]|nr:MAG: hypothetical protein DRN60_04570 [Nitrososphaerota archaeon]
MSKRDEIFLEIVLGAVLILAGFILSFLMVIKVIASSLFLSLFSYALSTAGLGLGITAAHGLMPKKPKRRLNEHEEP